MADIVWLASYPKSGNTWVRVLLTLYGAGEDADINAMSNSGGFQRAIFDRHCAIKSSCLSPEAVERLRPQMYRAVAAEARERAFVKIHDAWRRTDRGEPVIPADCTAGVVYILRNVLDVVASAASHWGYGIEKTVGLLCDPDMTLAASRKRLSSGLPQPLSSWSGHVKSWCDDSGLPLSVVRYEDLKADTVAAFAQILMFGGLAVDQKRLAVAVENARFERLKEVEKTAGFREFSDCARGNFFRKGRVGGWREELTQDQVRRLVDAHGDVMARFGYLDAQGEPV